MVPGDHLRAATILFHDDDTATPSDLLQRERAEKKGARAEKRKRWRVEVSRRSAVVLRPKPAGTRRLVPTIGTSRQSEIEFSRLDWRGVARRPRNASGWENSIRKFMSRRQILSGFGGKRRAPTHAHKSRRVGHAFPRRGLARSEVTFRERRRIWTSRDLCRLLSRAPD